MYFNNNNNFFHGIMFHHFHDKDIHTKGQGSISKDEFYKIINFIGKKNILDADIFFEKFKSKKLKNNEVCLTFDDAIKSQVDIALPVLEELKIKSFFFVYSSIFEGIPDNLETFRYFRMNYFNNINNFYTEFYKFIEKDLNIFFERNISKLESAKMKFPHYSIEDIKFRLVRDNFLNKKEYEDLMFLIMKEKKFNYKKFYTKLAFNENDLKKLDNLGHLIGLHSHSHPTLLEKLNYEDQKEEYKRNLSVISKILNKSEKDIKYMSHPCGSYNKNTLDILIELEIELGFKQLMTIELEKGMEKINNSSLEIARQDHSKIIKLIK
ncbi:polysaccharide deacetylase family protein [Candidatus Pelagibacter sp. FZCC0015]|uniref:polysaccharide deacetylase family protein n=1 Tax=Candidatus Pelagibacter sp. FZCC0015 TaxID=2268451 RepID=UPI0011A3FB85|nr:polysaccharide deacetylase family protein [Candidatus Pelagibacter sp. FZCC0015]